MICTHAHSADTATTATTVGIFKWIPSALYIPSRMCVCLHKPCSCEVFAFGSENFQNAAAERVWNSVFHY